MTDRTIIEAYDKWNNELEEMFCQLHKDSSYYIWDGVISPIHYFHSKIKILFINREAYDVNKDYFDLAKTIGKSIKNGEPFWVKQQLLKTSLKKEFVAIKAVVEKNNHEIKDILAHYTKNDLITDIQASAFINIKKSDGNTRSSLLDLFAHVQKDIDIIKEQIRYFNPSIIVGGNIVDGILEKEPKLEWGDNLCRYRSANIFQLKIGDNLYPYLDLYHPSSTRINAIEIYKAMKKVEQQNPLYWQKRLNLSCFDL